MQPASQVSTPTEQTGNGRVTHATRSHTGQRDTRRGTWRFFGNFLALIVAMTVGMGVVNEASRVFLTLTNLTFPAQYVELVALKMALDGAVGMVAWLRLRRHGWASALEMAGAMLAAPTALFPLLWLGAISGGSLILLEHLVVLPLIYLVMRRRRSQYEGHVQG